ncbi:MAG: ABC transporter permease, partial [Clostridia bacterium]|nr:ABC transporter permease [Clostridia bacterium]
MKKFFSQGYVFLVLAFIYIPIFILIMFSFSSNKNIGIWGAFTFEWYGKLGEVGDIVLNTVLLALFSSIISTILGTLGAIGLYYLKGKRKRFLNSVSQIPVVNSEIVTACALVMSFILIGVSNRSYFGLLIGHVILSAP